MKGVIGKGPQFVDSVPLRMILVDGSSMVFLNKGKEIVDVEVKQGRVKEKVNGYVVGDEVLSKNRSFNRLVAFSSFLRMLRRRFDI